MFEISTHPGISSIGAERWNHLNSSDYPFTQYSFLHALENSGSVTQETGWQPLHLDIQQDGKTRVLLPLYLKGHSWGEYVFDWSWAEAFERSGLDYYPKLLCAIPYTPASGPRWLSDLPDNDAERITAQALQQTCEHLNLETAHLLFPSGRGESLGSLGFQRRIGCQYHWFNQHYSDFEDFLSGFTARKRKAVRKERQKSVQQGISFHQFTADQLTPELMRTFYAFYVETYRVRGQHPYLTRAFFTELAETMPEQILLVLARHEDEYIAGALSFFDSSTLYGRYWGSLQSFDSLHFETCYYQGIDFCIQRGLSRFDPGAQGEHKIKRGFIPTETQSFHYIRRAQFRDAISQFLQEETRAVKQRITQLHTELPFKQQE